MSPNPQAPGYKEGIRLRKVYNLTSGRFWPNLAIIKNRKLSRYRSPANRVAPNIKQELTASKPV